MHGIVERTIKRFFFLFLEGDDNHYFRIDNSTGTIFVNSTIDRDAGIDYFELIVEVRFHHDVKCLFHESSLHDKPPRGRV